MYGYVCHQSSIRIPPNAHSCSFHFAIDPLVPSSADCCPSAPQLATQAGVLNVPQWYESGKIYAEAHPEVPQREHFQP